MKPAEIKALRALVTPITPKIQIYTKIFRNLSHDAKILASHVKFLKNTVCVQKKV